MRSGAPLTISLLGSAVVRTSDGRDLTPPGRKLRHLLACVALSNGKGWDREKLAELLWADRDERQARASLRQALAELRKLLGDLCPLKVERGTVGLDANAVSVDVDEFARLAAAGALPEAAALYRGDLLDGQTPSEPEFAAWIAIERTRLRDFAIDVFTNLAKVQVGDVAIATAQRLLEIDPLREESHRLLMQLYAAGGHRDRALRQYEICRDNLQAELGVTPEPETRALPQRIQQSGNGASPTGRSRPEAEVEGDGSSLGTAASEIPVRPTRIRRRAPAALWTAVVALLALGAAAVGYTYAVKQPAPVSAEAAIGLPVVLVLRFQNLTGHADHDQVGTGIAEDLRNFLWHSPEFQVTSATAETATSNNPKGNRETAQRFSAHFIITGSFRETGGRTVIVARLIDGSTGVDLWSDRFEERIVDPVELERAVAEQLSAELGGMTGIMRRAYERMAWRKPDAELTEYDYYVRGHGFHHTFKKDLVLGSQGIYEAGLDRYPDSALLRVKIAMVYVTGMWRWSTHPAYDAQQVRSYAREAARLLTSRRATRFEEYYVHWISAYADYLDGDYAGCMRHAEAATELNRYDAMLYADLAYEEAECGNVEKAVAWATQALKWEPDGLPENPDFYKNAMVWVLYHADRCPEALALAGGMQEQPLETIAACEIRLGAVDAARATMARFARQNPNWTMTDETTFPFQMVAPLRQRWFADIRAAGLPD